MANGYKQGRINEEVKRELALIIRDVKDPRIPPMTSVVHAQVLLTFFRTLNVPMTVRTSAKISLAIGTLL